MHINNSSLFLALFIFCFAGCSSSADDKRQDELKVFKYNQASALSSLDPAFAKDQATIWTANQLFSGLLKFDANLNILPDLATSWEVLEEGKKFKFKLRKDAFFHDAPCFPNGKGRRVNANDVVYSLNRIIDPGVASPGSWIFNDKITAENAFVALDEHTVEINLRKSFRPLLGILTMQYCFIVPREAVEHYGESFRANPVGSGPFKLKKWIEGNSLIMVKNEKFYEKEGGVQLPLLDGVRISFMENKRTSYLEFVKGNLHFLSGIDGSYVNDLIDKNGNLKEEHKGEIKMEKMPYLNTEYLGILMDHSNFGDKDFALKSKLVRQAIHHSIDKKAIISYLRNSIGKPGVSGFVPIGLPAYDEELLTGIRYDPKKASELFKQAGHPGGEGLGEIKLLTSSSYEDICILIAKQLNELGLKVKIELTPPAFQRELMAKGKAGFFRGSWIADYPDAESYLALFYSKYGSPPNYTRFKSEAYDILYESSLSENEDQKRYAMYREMQEILLDECPVIPLYYDEVVRFSRKGVSGLEPNAMNLLNLRKVTLD